MVLEDRWAGMQSESRLMTGGIAPLSSKPVLPPSRLTLSQFGRRFAVVVVPTYADPADALSSPFRSSRAVELQAEGQAKDSWRWFHTINRVCSGVKKVRPLSLHQTCFRS